MVLSRARPPCRQHDPPSSTQLTAQTPCSPGCRSRRGCSRVNQGVTVYEMTVYGAVRMHAFHSPGAHLLTVGSKGCGWHVPVDKPDPSAEPTMVRYGRLVAPSGGGRPLGVVRQRLCIRQRLCSGDGSMANHAASTHVVRRSAPDTVAYTPRAGARVIPVHSPEGQGTCQTP
jgi:hypothetical protein